MKIVPNSLLKPTEKCIKVWNCSYIAVEGPNVLGNLSLEDIAIPYESQYRGRMVLNPKSTDQPLLFEGFLGTDVTFVMVKVTYDSENDEYYRYEKEKYAITYRYADETTIRPIGRLLVLTGSETNRIPQIYLNNPYEYNVTLDILMANIKQPDFEYTNLDETVFSNLYYNSIITNESFIYGVPYTGSTQLIVLNETSQPIMYIPYTNIISTSLDIATKKIIITTLNSETIVLEFLTEFDMYQAYSRINWVQQTDGFSSGAYRFMTEDYVYLMNSGITGSDTISPQIIYNQTSGTTIPNVITLGLCHETYTGWTSEQLKDVIISDVLDNWDGDISFDDVLSIINKHGSFPVLSAITSEGLYRIKYEVRDIANNLTSDLIPHVYVDSAAPVITYNSGIITSSITGNTTTYSGFTGIPYGMIVSEGFTMSVSGQSPTGITSAELRDYIIDNVFDDVDVNVDKYDLVINKINNNGTDIHDIVVNGDYLIKLCVVDMCGNEKINYLILRTTGAPDATSPVITYNTGTILSSLITGNTTTYSGFTGIVSGITVVSGFTMSISGQSPTGITSADISSYIINVVSDVGDPTVNVSSLVYNKINRSGNDISNVILPSSVAGDYLVKLFVEDINNNSTTDYLILRAQN